MKRFDVSSASLALSIALERSHALDHRADVVSNAVLLLDAHDITREQVSLRQREGHLRGDIHQPLELSTPLGREPALLDHIWKAARDLECSLLGLGSELGALALPKLTV
eukprot:1523858-Pyramimonas_sp.AAC.1